MSAPRILLALAALALMTAADRTFAQDVARENDPEAIAREGGVTETEVAEVVLAFKAALAEGDSTAALSHLHPELVVFEGGHAETLSEYRAGHLAADMEFAGSVEFDVTRSDVLVHPHTALWLSAHTASGTFRGRPIDARGVETMVLVPVDGEWRILHIHWSSR